MKEMFKYMFSFAFLLTASGLCVKAQETDAPLTAQPDSPTEVMSEENTNDNPITEELSSAIIQETNPVAQPEEPTEEIVVENKNTVDTAEVTLKVNVALDGWQDSTHYYRDGVAVNGMQKIGSNYFLFKNHELDTSFTGFAKSPIDNTWYFVREGKSDWKFTGLAKSIYDNKWYFSENGKLNWNYTGISKSVENNKWYFSRNGKLDWGFTGVAKSVENNKWYHVKRGELDWAFTGLSKSVENGKWYFSRNGKLDWGFTGVAKSIADNQWYHAKNGELDWKFIGISKSVENGKWYFSRNGKLDWGFTGVAKSVENNKWYHVNKGRLDWGFTGLSKSVENGKYYYSNNGKLNWGFTGVGKSISDNQWYYVVKGLLNWKYNGNARDKDGNLYAVSNGRATLIVTDGNVYMTGIDISQWNGHIDLSQYIGQFVIIRVAYGTSIDPLAKRNMDLCEALGIPYGVYLYSYALNTAGAQAEANFLLDVIRGRNIQVGVWYDMEDADNYKRNNNAFSGQLMTDMCNTFCSIVSSRGYYTGIYSSASWFTSYLPGTNAYPWWVAHWGVNDGNHNVNTSNMGPMQQFTSVPLDRNVIYQPLSFFKR